MTKEILLQILNQKLYFHLLLIILSHCIVWFTIINFEVYLLTRKIISVRILPFIMLGALWTLFGRTFLPNNFFGFIVLAIFCISIKILVKATIIETIIISIMTYIIIGISVVLIQQPLFSLYPLSIDFIMNTPMGMVMGSLFEIVLPILILFIIHSLQLQPKLFVRKKITFLDIAGVFLMLDLFYLFYNLSLSILRNYTNHQFFSMNTISYWSCSVAGILAFYIILKYTQKDYEKQIKEKEELKKQLREVFEQNNEVIIDAVKSIKNSETGSEIVDSTINLTDNEIKVLKLLIDGKSNKEISASLNINTGTVRNIISKLLDKFDLDDRTQLAIFAIKNLRL